MIKASWQRVQSAVPAQHRIGGRSGSTPREEVWRWRDCGVRLDRYGPPDAPARLLVLHGAGGNGRLVGTFAVAAARNGFAAVCPDLPGWGSTSVPDRSAVRYDDWVACASDLLRAEAARGPVVVLGLSVGGMLGYDAVSRVGAAGLVATSLLDVRDPAVRRAVGRFGWLAPLGDRVLPRLRRLDGVLVPVRWVARTSAIANDPAVARAVSTDPTAGGAAVPLGWLRTFLASAPPVEPEEFDVCPVVLAHPAADRWTPLEVSLPFLHRIRPERRSVVLLERAGHLPIEQPGLDQLAEVVLSTLARHADGPPRGHRVTAG